MIIESLAFTNAFDKLEEQYCSSVSDESLTYFSAKSDRTQESVIENFNPNRQSYEHVKSLA